MFQWKVLVTSSLSCVQQRRYAPLEYQSSLVPRKGRNGPINLDEYILLIQLTYLPSLEDESIQNFSIYIGAFAGHFLSSLQPLKKQYASRPNLQRHVSHLNTLFKLHRNMLCLSRQMYCNLYAMLILARALSEKDNELITP